MVDTGKGSDLAVSVQVEAECSPSAEKEDIVKGAPPDWSRLEGRFVVSVMSEGDESASDVKSSKRELHATLQDASLYDFGCCLVSADDSLSLHHLTVTRAVARRP